MLSSGMDSRKARVGYSPSSAAASEGARKRSYLHTTRPLSMMEHIYNLCADEQVSIPNMLGDRSRAGIHGAPNPPANPPQRASTARAKAMVFIAVQI